MGKESVESLLYACVCEIYLLLFRKFHEIKFDLKQVDTRYFNISISFFLR